MVKQEKNMQEEGSTANTGQWLKLSFICPQALVEAASDLLAVQSGSGVEQSPESGAGSRLSGFFYIEAADAEKEAGQVEDVLSATKDALRELFALYGKPLPELEHELLANEDWATSWQQYFKPFAIAPGLVIKPSWEDYAPGPGEQVLEMDPGMAFGTGQHASTRGALQLMQQCCKETIPEKVLDVGTGTGILAMAAALWGAAEVLAIDNDPEAVRVARENVAQNALSGQIRVESTSLEALEGSYALICANIVHDVLLAMLPHLSRLAARPGYLVMAGILAGTQERSISKAYRQAGFTLLGCEYEDEWVALLFVHPAK